MQVDRPDQGTGAAEAAPHRRPNWVAVLTDVKIAAVAGGSSALIPSCQTRLPMWGSEDMVNPEKQAVNQAVQKDGGHRKRWNVGTPPKTRISACF